MIWLRNNRTNQDGVVCSKIIKVEKILTGRVASFYWCTCFIRSIMERGQFKRVLTDSSVIKKNHHKRVRTHDANNAKSLTWHDSLVDASHLLCSVRNPVSSSSFDVMRVRHVMAWEERSQERVEQLALRETTTDQKLLRCCDEIETETWVDVNYEAENINHVIWWSLITKH